jgi:hypothetical protein
VGTKEKEMTNPYKAVNVDKLMKENEELKKEVNKLKYVDVKISNKDSMGALFDYLAKQNGWELIIDGIKIYQLHHFDKIIRLEYRKNGYSQVTVTIDTEVIYEGWVDKNSIVRKFEHAVHEIAEKNKQNGQNKLMADTLSDFLNKKQRKYQKMEVLPCMPNYTYYIKDGEFYTKNGDIRIACCSQETAEAIIRINKELDEK